MTEQEERTVLRLEISQREIRSFINDRSFNRVVGPDEVNGLAKLKEALALISEAKHIFAAADYGQPVKKRA